MGSNTRRRQNPSPRQTPCQEKHPVKCLQRGQNRKNSLIRKEDYVRRRGEQHFDSGPWHVVIAKGNDQVRGPAPRSLTAEEGKLVLTMAAN